MEIEKLNIYNCLRDFNVPAAILDEIFANEKDLDILIITDPSNMNYTTGYDGWSFYTPQMVLITLSEKQPYWIGRKMDAVGAKFTAFLGQVSLNNKNTILQYMKFGIVFSNIDCVYEY